MDKNVCVVLEVVQAKWAFEWLREDFDRKPVDWNGRMLLWLKVYRFLFLSYINNTFQCSLFPHLSLVSIFFLLLIPFTVVVYGTKKYIIRFNSKCTPSLQNLCNFYNFVDSKTFYFALYFKIWRKKMISRGISLVFI